MVHYRLMLPSKKVQQQSLIYRVAQKSKPLSNDKKIVVNRIKAFQ